MIPKIIHYCWFGRGEKPTKVQKCIESWKKFCPDYEIIEWNEDNFDIHKNGYTEYCYQNKKYAFLSDYVRLLVVEEYGGVYFDTDVEVVRPIDELLSHQAFFGFENEQFVASGLGFGAEAHAPTIKAMVHEYDPLLSGENGVQGCPLLNTQALIPFGLQQNGTKQEVAGAVIYPTEYFNPYDSATGRLNKTDNTYTIHWYSAFWQSNKSRVMVKITRVFHRVFGVHCFDWLNRLLKRN